VGGIAHDFNNLLSAVVGNAELALLRLPEASPARELVEQAALAGQRSAELVKQLLTYSAKAPFTRQRVNINELVRELAELLAVTVGKQTKLELELPPEPLPVVTDPTQLRQVLMNLVHNAADSMAGREGAVTVKTSFTHLDEPRGGVIPALPPGPYVRIEVTDTGAGIEPGTLERIFDPFFTTKVAGRGLGLSAVRTIAQRHGGGVFVDSKPGVGSTFTVLLPVAPAEGDESRLGPVWVDSPLPLGATVLVVDDDEALQRVLSQVLTELGLVPLVAGRASTARELAREHPEVRCALVDLTVPESGGPALVHQLHTTRPDVPVLLMSAFAEADVGGDAAGFLAKPFTPQALQAALGRALHPAH
jgi:CheY-like chemotaxis protein